MNAEPTTRSRKRKAEEQLSTNPNTVKARKRNKALSQDPVRKVVEKAKAADQGAVIYTRKKLGSTHKYQTVSAERQKEMI